MKQNCEHKVNYEQSGRLLDYDVPTYSCKCNDCNKEYLCDWDGEEI